MAPFLTKCHKDAISERLEHKRKKKECHRERDEDILEPLAVRG